MAFDFTGKRVVVTGAGQGIGKGLVQSLSKAGAKVVAVSKTKSNLDKLAAEVPGLETIPVDLGDWDATRAALAAIGPVDGLVNNAGLYVGESFLNLTKEGLEQTFNLNLYGLLNVSQLVAKGMVESKTGGSIVNISSQASQAALTDHLSYGASKAAVDQASRIMALELGKHNIRVNCVNPTVVLTAMSQGWLDPAKGGPMLEKIPLGRFAEVQEVVDVVMFLLSDKSTMVHGITLPVDGGYLAT